MNVMLDGIDNAPLPGGQVGFEAQAVTPSVDAVQEFRGEMFNFTNTPYFGLPNGVLNNVNAGTINAAGPPR